MSYILDALRKSDQQRQHGQTPTLGNAPLPAAHPVPRGMPKWLPLSLLALLLISAGLAIGILRPWQAAPLPPEPLAPVAAPSQPAPEPERVPVQVQTQTPAPVLATAPKPADSAAAEVIPPPPIVAVQAPPTAVVKATSNTQPPPPVRMTVHAYSNDPGDRLVGINGRMLREGQEIEAGFKVERITPDGAVLNFQGRRFRHDMR